MNIQHIKQRFGIIGHSKILDRAMDIAIQVAPTDLTVLIIGESGVGKESFPKIIHHYSVRKHARYIAVNCGAIPEGTIDSELFGHMKGSFTGALSDRKGYFQEADGGTIFLDEVAELPSSTQVRLLRVLESGEFIKVGASKVQKTDVRVVAATNIDLENAVNKGKFREDLFYRLNTVPIIIPPLRARKEDIYLLFRKFAADFAENYQMPAIKLSDEGIKFLKSYRWPGNIRQLKNITEQISVIEQNRNIPLEKLMAYFPKNDQNNLPAIIRSDKNGGTMDFATEREILYKVLFDMKQDMNELKKLVFDLIENKHPNFSDSEKTLFLKKQYQENEPQFIDNKSHTETLINPDESSIQDTEEYVEESLSLIDKEKELIVKALDKHRGRRKAAAKELGISERTLYRKIKEYEIKP